MQPETQDEILWRLHNATGHLHVVSEMVEAGRPCEEVIHQLGAVMASLRVAGTRYLDCQVKPGEEIILNGNMKTWISELAHLHKLYLFLMQQSNNESDANV